MADETQDDPNEELDERDDEPEGGDDQDGGDGRDDDGDEDYGDAPSVPAGPPSIRAAAKQLYRNTLSYLGMAVMVAAAAVIIFSIVSQLTVAQPSPYVGIFTYLIFPGVLLLGLGLFLFGMRREARRRRRVGTTAAQPFPVINFNRPEHRRWLAYMVGAGVVVFTVVGTVTYNAYVYTGSTEFCGTTCHVPMGPEYTAYLDSAHARVACVDCHIGGGAEFFVKAKVNGAKQVVMTWLNSYERPIPITTQQLRPARDTCEKCHWPDKSYGAKLKQVPHFRYDENNTAEQISFTMRIGGGNPEHGESAGIHWHMLIDNEVTYAALDNELQDIPWTQVKHHDGTITRYVSTNAKVSKDKLESLEKRTMDCMDCHNRPAHTFPVPDRAIDEAMSHGQIDFTIPWIKKIAVEVVNLHAEDESGGAEAVARDVVARYEKEFPEVLAKRHEAIEHAARVAGEIWKRSAFPDMKLTWRTYPSNIGHRYWPGCFRCHDGKHVSEDGKVLDKTCDGQCHTAPSRGAIEPLGFVDPMADAEDWHPWELPAEHLKIQAHREVACYQCHEAGKRPSSECKDCHESRR